MKFSTFILPVLLSFAVVSCRSSSSGRTQDASSGYASYFNVEQAGDGTFRLVVSSPYSADPDTLHVVEALHSIVCMSTTAVAGFSVLGASDAVTAVSGLDYVSDPYFKEHAVLDVGYDADLDYEALLKLAPDLVLAYSSSAAKPAYVEKLESLGIRVLMLYDHLEEHPLARAEYIKLYGAMVGKYDLAVSFFKRVASDYESIASSASSVPKVPVLMNVPYAGTWYVPGKDSYMSKLVSDAGAYVLGSQDGAESSVISLEKAFALSADAEVWLDPGWCRSRAEIAAIHPLIAEFPVLKEGRIFNNIKRANDSGGNDFWESGSIRPDLILSDLVRMMHPELGAPGDSLEYYVVVQ